MVTSTKEKRALWMKLTAKLAHCLPAENLSLVISDEFLKSVVTCRTKEQNVLYDYAGGILGELLIAVGW